MKIDTTRSSGRYRAVLIEILRGVYAPMVQTVRLRDRLRPPYLERSNRSRRTRYTPTRASLTTANCPSRRICYASN